MGQDELTKGIGRLRDEGMAGMKDAIDEFSDIAGNNGDSYTSFVDDRNDNNSSCQFIMKTPAIKLEKTNEKLVVENKLETNLLQRLLNLFKR